MIKIKNLTKNNFKKYGYILEPDYKDKVFSILCGDKDSKGWRIGYVTLGKEPIKKLEKHPDSFETFEPVKGISILVVGVDTEKLEAFLLDKPICINKNVWHALYSLSEKVEVKITENFEVESNYFELEKEIIPFLIKK